jgi:DNA-binding GntR family transcriptional regulator
VDAELMPIDQRLDKLEGPVSAMLERVYGVHIGRIDQAIDAVALSRRHAKLLRAAAGGPALRAVRRYYDPNGRLFELSIALHPGDRFSYVTSLIGQ